MSIEEPEVYFFQALISYLNPMKQAVGVEAANKEEAELFVRQLYGHHMNFDLISLDVARDDIARNWRKGQLQ